MKLLISVFFLFVIFAQDTNLMVEGFISIFGIIDSLLGGFKDLLDSIIDHVRMLVDRLQSTISDLASRVFDTVFNLIDNLISLVDGLLTKAKNSDKVIDDCVKQAAELELLKPKISNAVDECQENLKLKIAIILEDLKGEKDRGEGLISSLLNSLQNCATGVFAFSCISKAQQSSFQEFQGVVNNTEIIGEKIYLATNEVTKCIKDVEENGTQLANQMYKEIERCISEAPHRK